MENDRTHESANSPMPQNALGGTLETLEGSPAAALPPQAFNGSEDGLWGAVNHHARLLQQAGNSITMLADYATMLAEEHGRVADQVDLLLHRSDEYRAILSAGCNGTVENAARIDTLDDRINTLDDTLKARLVGLADRMANMEAAADDLETTSDLRLANMEAKARLVDYHTTSLAILETKVDMLVNLLSARLEREGRHPLGRPQGWETP